MTAYPNRGVTTRLTEVEGSPEPPSALIDGHSRDSRAPNEAWSLRDRFLPALLAIACLIVAWSLVLPRWFHYQQDDVWEFSLADSEGLSWKFVAVNGFEHFGPITRMNHWVEWSISPYNYGLGVAIAIVFVTLLLLSVTWLIDELKVPPRRRIPLLVTGGLAMPLFSVAAWNDQSVYIVPTLAVTYAVMASHARGLRTASLRFHLLACGLLLIAVGLQERGGIAVLLTLLMDIFLLGRGQPWNFRARTLWQVRWQFVGLFAIAAADAIVWKLFYVWPGQRHSDLSTGARVVAAAFGQYLLPSFVGVHASLQGGIFWVAVLGVVIGIAYFAL